LGALAAEGLAGGGGKEIAELADLGQQTRLGRLGDAKDGHHGRDTDADTEHRQRGAESTGAEPDAADAKDVAGI
jgi:hypothetical protein